jgi:hypothetical protein
MPMWSRLTRSKSQERLYRRETYFREGLRDAAEELVDRRLPLA